MTRGKLRAKRVRRTVREPPRGWRLDGPRRSPQVSAMSLMRAARFHENGSPSVLTLEDVPIPEPGPGEVRVKVRAAALNHLDLWVRRGLPIETTMPHIGGSDIAGEVDLAGAGVVGWSAGDRVVVDPVLNWDWYERASAGGDPRERPLQLIGEHTDGGFAEYAIVPAANLMRVPEQVTLETAAAAALNFVTAWHALTTRGQLKAGERLLVTGASGGVATAAVQLGAHLGARVVAVTSGASNVARLGALGAHHVVDRLEGDWVADVRRATEGRGANLVIDSVGEAMWKGIVRSLAVMGRVVCYGATTGPRSETDLRHLFWKQLTVMGSTMGSPAEFREVMALVFEDVVSPVIDEIMPLERIREAHERLEDGGVFGKLVLTP